jgi:hypothetical protein
MLVHPSCLCLLYVPWCLLQIFKLLLPHFKYTLPINAAARGALINANGECVLGSTLARPPPTQQ